MQVTADFFRDKKITIMGLGLLGRGVGDAEYIARAGAKEVIVTDLKSEAELQEPFNRLKVFPNVRFVFGEHRMEDFENRNLVLVAAGVPLDSPYVAHAKEANTRVVQSAALFAELSKIPIIGVTGTRGKSTVTHMIHHVLEYATGEKVLLGGNVRGVSNLQLLNDVKEDSLAVMELDSWQLQGFGWSEISPQVAVFTSFMEDHMNYYKGDMNAYFADKANIFLYQEEGDTLITTSEVFKLVKEYVNKKHTALVQEVVLVEDSTVPEDAHLAMPGKHNRLNAALAIAALKATGLGEEEIFEGLATFKGVPGRLEYLCEIDGVKIYNDNNATEPNATIAGLRALGKEEERNIVLLAGGSDKNVALEPLVAEIEKYCKAVFLLPGTGTDRLSEIINASNSLHIEQVETLFGGVSAARSAATEGDVILFSPAFASFGMFKNEYDRNDQFLSIISGYENNRHAP